MAYIAPSTVSTLQTYTSAAHNIIVNDIIDHESRISTVQNAQYALKNLLINGAMQFAQRGSSVTGVSATGYYTADRWVHTFANGGTFTSAISADAPTGSGLRNSLRLTCSATAASAAGTLLVVGQRLEGQTLQMVRKGTSSAQQLTLQFWVKSNRVGSCVAELFDNDNTRQVSSLYTINSADTWEQKTVTFPADTSGAFDNDNAESLSLRLWFSAGTDFTSGSLNTTWNANTNANRAAGQTVRIGTAASDYLAITGVQLEVGSVASPYEFLQYDEELRRCQRYYEKSYNIDVAPGTNTSAGAASGALGVVSGSGNIASVFYKATKRITVSNTTFYTPAGTAGSWISFTSGGVSANRSFVVATNGATGFGGYLNSSGTDTYYQGHYTADAEL